MYEVVLQLGNKRRSHNETGGGTEKQNELVPHPHVANKNQEGYHRRICPHQGTPCPSPIPEPASQGSQNQEKQKSP